MPQEFDWEKFLGPKKENDDPLAPPEAEEPAAVPEAVAEPEPEPEPEPEQEPVAESEPEPEPEPDHGSSEELVAEAHEEQHDGPVESPEPAEEEHEAVACAEPPMPPTEVSAPPMPTVATEPPLTLVENTAPPKDNLDMDLPANRFEDDEDGNPYMPAPVPLHVLEPEKGQGKYFVGDIQPDEFTRITEQALPVDQVHIDEILRMAVERKASDVHLTAGLPPMIRMDGEICALPYEVLDPNQTQRLCYEVLTDEHLQKFEQTHELDIGYTVKDLARFRMNIYMQRMAVGAALRMIPNRIPSFEELSLPPIIREIAKRSSGLVLVTGPTGSGKSTTIASMIDDINATRTSHIMTIEDPIEYLHKHKKCMVNQRELHSDTYSLHNALRAVLREDPDIILVGELRDLETIEAALTLAETGHLVFGTLHTRNAPATIDRVVDVFPSDQQDQIRVLLANTIEGVISQQLMPRLGGGRRAALEIMIGVPAIKNLIREGKTHQMYSVIETSQNVGMQTMDRSLSDLYRQGQVSFEECLMRAVDKDSFSRLAKSA